MIWSRSPAVQNMSMFSKLKSASDADAYHALSSHHHKPGAVIDLNVEAEFVALATCILRLRAVPDHMHAYTGARELRVAIECVDKSSGGWVQLARFGIYDTVTVCDVIRIVVGEHETYGVNITALTGCSGLRVGCPVLGVGLVGLDNRFAWPHAVRRLVNSAILTPLEARAHPVRYGAQRFGQRL